MPIRWAARRRNGRTSDQLRHNLPSHFPGTTYRRVTHSGRYQRRTRVVGTFPDGESALMLVAARLRYVAGTKWGTRRYLSRDKLRAAAEGTTQVRAALALPPIPPLVMLRCGSLGTRCLLRPLLQ